MLEIVLSELIFKTYMIKNITIYMDTSPIAQLQSFLSFGY